MPGKLGILAGGGDLPARLARVCRADGREVFVLAFEGQTDPRSVAGVEHAWCRLGAIGRALETLRKADVRDLVMVGPIKRPSLGELKLDRKGMQLLAKVGIDILGDDGLLRAVVGTLEAGGFNVVGVDDILAGALAPEGRIGAVAPDAEAQIDIERGVAVARTLGAADVGQSVVVQQGIVLGVEAAEGTDALLDRCGGLRRDAPGGVLVKLKKPQQETRVDLPTIGVTTVRNAAAAGLRGIAVQAGGALVIDRAAVAREADAAGLFVVGIRIDE
jgi:UDP-2,3-diacylglucosamine hydrolase